MKLSVALLLSFVPFISADGIKEPKGSKVSVLNKDLFPRFISRSSLVLMEWYAPWCGHCQELAPKYREAAEILSEMKKKGEIPQAVKFAKMNDGDEYNHAGRFGAPENYNFTAYPALYIFKDGDLKNPEPYYGGREVDDIVAWMAAVAKGLDPIEEEKKARPGLYKFKTTDVLELSPETFNATVKLPSNMQNNLLYIVEFYSDRCPYCKILSPEVIQASQTLQAEEPRVVMGACNTRIYYDVADQNGITGYPWVAAFYNGKKVEDMAGLGGADSIVQFAKRMVKAHYDESLGETPARMEVTYDEEGVLQLEPYRLEWFATDKAKWEEIEAQKIAGTYIEPEPEVKPEVHSENAPPADAPADMQGKVPPPPPPQEAPPSLPDMGDAEADEAKSKTMEQRHEEMMRQRNEEAIAERQRREREEVELERKAREDEEKLQQRQRAAASSSSSTKSGFVLNAENKPPPADAKLGPMIDGAGGDAVLHVAKKIKQHEANIEKLRLESQEEARRNIFGRGAHQDLDGHDGEHVEVNANGKIVSQEDIDKGAAWRATLGRQTWFFLHTLAAKYPEYPSEVDERAVRNLVASLGQLYPCKLCRSHLRLKLMQESLGPVRTHNRTALATWFCELHNMVNVDTGKTHYHDCSPFNLDLQYLKDCGECEGPSAANATPQHGGETSDMEQSRPVFDARTYAKDGIQFSSEMSEAMEALAGRMYELDQENILLKKAWPSDVPRPV